MENTRENCLSRDTTCGVNRIDCYELRTQLDNIELPKSCVEKLNPVGKHVEHEALVDQRGLVLVAKFVVL